MSDAGVGLERVDVNTDSDRPSGSSSAAPKRTKKVMSEAQLAALAKGRSARAARKPSEPAAEPARPQEVPPPREPSPVKRKEEPVEELTDILAKPTPRARKGRSDRGGTRGSYIDKALAAAKTVEKAQVAPPTIMAAPRYNIVIV